MCIFTHLFSEKVCIITHLFKKGVYNYTTFQKRCVKLQIFPDMNFKVCNYTHLSDENTHLQGV